MGYYHPSISTGAARYNGLNTTGRSTVSAKEKKKDVNPPLYDTLPGVKPLSKPAKALTREDLYGYVEMATLNQEAEDLASYDSRAFESDRLALATPKPKARRSRGAQSRTQASGSNTRPVITRQNSMEITPARPENNAEKPAVDAEESSAPNPFQRNRSAEAPDTPPSATEGRKRKNSLIQRGLNLFRQSS